LNKYLCIVLLFAIFIPALASAQVERPDTGNGIQPPKPLPPDQHVLSYTSPPVATGENFDWIGLVMIVQFYLCLGFLILLVMYSGAGDR